MIRRRIPVILACCLVAAGFLLWWFYGSRLSEETAYKLAENYAQTYAKRNHLDLSLYVPPNIGTQKGDRLYTFSWIPSEGGKPLTITVDRMNVEVDVIESP